MANGYSLHIGLNKVDNEQPGYRRMHPLRGAENDAKDMAKIAAKCGFTTKVLLSGQATKDVVISAIQEVAGKMTGDDIFLLTYAGHGNSINDTDGDEDDGKDETLCLYDSQLIDDELAELWTLFPEGSRILMVADSCHSGSVLRFVAEQYDNNLLEGIDIKASVKLISACQDYQYAEDNEEGSNGLFTEKLKSVWEDGAFKGNYVDFVREIKSRLHKKMDPNLYNIGLENKEFNIQSPFKI